MSTMAPGYEFKKPIRDKVQNLKQIPTWKLRFSTAEARGPSVCFGFFLLPFLSLSLHVRASGTRVGCVCMCV